MLVTGVQPGNEVKIVMREIKFYNPTITINDFKTR